MGKTQSKRSVDITTEDKKNSGDEVTGKLEKIEDVDQQKHGNGEASQGSNEVEKKIDAEEPENDKDLTTEKNDQSEENTDDVEAQARDSNLESTLNEGNSLVTEGSAKKSKKEKVKKKWSFRSISFGKKDKQKPNKSEETTEEIVTNGEAEKSETMVEKKNESRGDDAGCDAEIKPNAKAIALDKNINNDPKSTTPIKKSPEGEVDIIEKTCVAVDDASKPACITEVNIQTDGKEIFSTVNAFDEVSNVVCTIDKLEISLEKNIATIIDSSESSALNTEVICKGVNKNENEENDPQKSQENGTIEEQQLIEVNTNNASEGHIRSHPSTPNVIEENENVAVENDDHNQQKEQNKVVNSCDISEKIEQCDSLPPPLPCSPPPSQVSQFAFNNDADSSSKDVLNSFESAIVESLPKAELIEVSKHEKINENNVEKTKDITVPIVISNELKNNDSKVFSKELSDSAYADQQINCVKFDSNPVNLVDIDCAKELQEPIADKTDQHLEKEGEIAAMVVQEITANAVLLCQQQINENENCSNNASTESNEDKDCNIDLSITDSTIANNAKETLTEICKEQVETKRFMGQEIKIVQPNLND